MALFIHDRTVRQETCSDCGDEFDHVTGFVNDSDGPYAAYFAACHGHPEHKAQIDVVLGMWGTDKPLDDHTTFSCRLRPDGAMAVDATVAVDRDSGGSQG